MALASHSTQQGKKH